jgi:hypothetical protein
MDKTAHPQISLILDTCKDKGKAIQILKKLYLIDSKKKYPTVPDFARVVPPYNDKTANGLTRCIIDFLRFTGSQSERVNCIGKVIDSRKTYTDVIGLSRTIGRVQYIPTTGQKGTADISATIKGRSVKIEIKIGKDRQSEHQKQYQESIEASGGIYFIARNFQQFYNWYWEKFGRVDNGKG